MRFSENEPDLDRYDPKPADPQDDLDVPDFDAPDEPMSIALDGSSIATVVVSSLASAIDPAEHAAHALIEALTTLEQQIVLNYDLERANQLRQMLQRAWQHVDLVAGKAASRVDEILERRR